MIDTFDILEEDLLEANNELVEKVSSQIKEQLQKTQSQVITLHGLLSETKQKYLLPTITCVLQQGRRTKEDEKKDIYVDKTGRIQLDDLNIFFGQEGPPKSSKRYSLILNGLEDNHVVITKKINHIMLRQCQNVTLELQKGTVSGIDILMCKKIILKTLMHNYVQIEYVSEINMFGEADTNSKICVMSSMDVRFENIKLPTNIFGTQIFIKNRNDANIMPVNDTLFSRRESHLTFQRL